MPTIQGVRLMLIHTVFFWLKETAPAGERERLARSCLELLGKVPSVRQIWAGPPANTPKREIIDASYDVGLTVVLDDLPGHDIYQEHPLHKDFIARHKEQWKRVQIYDYERAD
jgi:stress responsive alpha/beta barrel protein